MKRNITGISAGLALCLVAGTAGATVFQIDEFSVTENDTIYWLDTFGDGAPPLDRTVQPVAPVDVNAYDRAYLTRPLPGLPGPEAGGKLALNPAQGFLNIGTVTPVPNRIQRARVNSYNGAGAPEDGKLTADDAIVVSATYDLIEPLQNTEYYGIRLTDWADFVAGEGLRLAVRKNLAGVWQVVFSQAVIGGQWDTIDSGSLSDVVGIGDYEQIVLSLFNDPTDPSSGTEFTAQVTLLDLDGLVANQTFTSEDTGLMFQVSDWLRPEFLAGVRVPAPAALSLLLLGLAGMRLARRTPAA